MSMRVETTFHDSVADCSTCLDLNKEYLRRQWRSVGGIFAADAPYSLTLRLLAENLSSTGCEGCALLSQAAGRIKEEYGLGFRNAVVEFLGDEQRSGLSLTLTMLHPVHTQPGDWEKAQGNPDLRVAAHTGPSKQSPNRDWEYRISSPVYELFLPLASSESESDLEDTYFKLARGMLMVQAAHTQSHPAWNSILRRPSRRGDTGSEAALQFTRSELEHCQNNHQECNLNLDEGGRGLPTRVLDLGAQNQLTSDIKLYVSRNEPEAYVCLSHCWGSDRELRPLETTVETLHQFEQGISYNLLPKTFEDAVVFTRKLGYRFLWIDSLCIVQDDSEDWLREAGRMTNIYDNAVLTLAAASSPDSKGGLFRQSTPGVLLGHGKPGTVQPALRQFSNPAFFEYGRLPSVRAKHGSDDTSPLLKRAWIYQERMLSGRVLFFTPLELVFECRSSNRTESGYPWIDSRPKHAFASVYNPDCPKDLLVTLCRRLVVEFTQLKLTLNKDKLPAIAGVATRFSKRLEGGQSASYFAGSWKETFIEDMLWEPSSRIGSNPPRVNGCIPTWSWARSDRPKSYRPSGKNLKALCRLEEVVCVPLGSSSNVFTGISSGYAALSGYLLPAKMTRTGIVIDKNPRVHHIPERDYDWSAEGPGKISDGDELFILPLLASQEKTEHDIQTRAAVLRRCCSVDDAFERIGVCGWPISVHHLQGHHYIFEGADFCLEMYRKLVSYGKSLLGQDGLYRIPGEEKSVNPHWLASEAENLQSDFFLQARYRHLCLYGPKSKVKIEDFLGQMHVDVLEAAMSAERDRVEEWRRRNERSEEQVHKRTLIKIV